MSILEVGVGVGVPRMQVVMEEVGVWSMGMMVPWPRM